MTVTLALTPERRALIDTLLRELALRETAPAVRLAEMTTDYFRPAVARGADFLDRVITAPEWRPEVDPERLDLANAHRCVLGQVFGTYAYGLSRLRIYGQAVDLGFTTGSGPVCEDGLCCSGPRGPWEALTEAWRLELRSS